MNIVKERELFEEKRVSSAVFRLAFPTVIGQIILVIYNMADTFFVGLTGNDAFSASAYTIISFFQATGDGKKSFLLAILRKGLVDIPLMFIFSRPVPIFGIVMATPLADAFCCLIANLMFISFLKQLFSPDIMMRRSISETAG